MENLDLIVDNGNSNPVSGPNTNLVISQQEVVSSVADLGLKKPFQLSKYQIIKQESVENTDEPLQINLDPGHMLSEAGIGDIPNIDTPADDAIKLLASHGITMLPEESPTLSLTEAGKLALSDVRKTSLTTVKKITPISPGSITPKITRIVRLKSSPMKNSIINTSSNIITSPVSSAASNSKPIPIIRLTPAQTAMIKNRAAMLSKNTASTTTVSNDNEVNKENGEVLDFMEEDDVSEEPRKKIIKLDNKDTGAVMMEKESNGVNNSKEELQRKLQEQLKQKELECESLKAQLDALSQ